MQTDKDSGAHAGITRTILAAALKADVLPEFDDALLGNPPLPRHLNADQVARVYDWYLNGTRTGTDAQGRPTYTGGPFGKYGTAALNGIQDQRTVDALVDTAVRHGGPAGTLTVQETLNRLLAQMTPEQRQRLGLPTEANEKGEYVDQDRSFGGQTRDALTRYVNAGPEHAAAFRQALAEQRRKQIRREVAKEAREEVIAENQQRIADGLPGWDDEQIKQKVEEAIEKRVQREAKRLDYYHN